MSVINLAINEFDLTQEEIGFIRTRHSSKQLAFALLFKYYQKSHQFIDDLTKLPAYFINIVHYSEAFTRLNPSDLKQMADNKRCAHTFMYCHTRKEEIIDKTIDMFNRIIRNVIHKSERRVVKKLINDVKKVYGKDTILFNIAEICLEQPDGTIRDTIFPIIG